MCGILGIHKKDSKNDFSLFSDRLDLINHRGPDDHGIWANGDSSLMLGHKRLSILDLSSSGKQPMINQSNNDVIIFNGEIYNHEEIRLKLISLGHKFKSTSDTEVLLKAYQEWEENCLHELNGMFSFAIFDSLRNRLFLARDRAGEKPFYYSLNSHEFKFSSELKPLIHESNPDKSIDKKSLDCFLSFGYSPKNGSIFTNIKKLEAGKFIFYDLNTNELTINSFWDIKSKLNNSDLSPSKDINYYVDKLEFLLEDSINLQLEADVPVGILLSGGLDSSIITSIASRRKKLKTFTVKFSDYDNYDESRHARLIAESFDTEHIELEASKISPEIINEMVIFFDEPMLDSSMIPTYLLSREVRKYCKVAIGGDGGDELFGGYKHYDRLIRLSQITKYFPLILREFIGEFSQHILPIGFKGRNWAHAISKDFKKSVPQISVFFNHNDRKKLLLKNKFTQNYADKYRSNSFLKDLSLLKRATVFDFLNYLSEDILVKIDRASMASSLEMRAPFLDYRIIEFAFLELPDSLKANSKQRKIILKKLAEKILPENFDLKRKQGFSLPLEKFYREQNWREFIEFKLFDKNKIFEEKVLRDLFKSIDGNRSNSERIFGLVLFNTWLEKYDISI